MRTDIKINRLGSATILSSQMNFLSYDHKASEDKNPFQTIITFSIFPEFISELEGSGIVKITECIEAEKSIYRICSLILTPQFGFNNQKFEDIIYQLFNKYNL